MNKVLLSCGITCAMFLAGCGGSKAPETAKEEAAAPASAPAAIDEANAATVATPMGHIHFHKVRIT